MYESAKSLIIKLNSTQHNNERFANAFNGANGRDEDEKNGVEEGVRKKFYDRLEDVDES